MFQSPMSGGTMSRPLARVLLERYHAVDFSLLLPLLARLPLPLAYLLAAFRGWLHAKLGIDWRAIAFGVDLQRLTAASFRQMLPGRPEEEIASLVRKRYMAQAREEFEAHLVMADRIDDLSCSFLPGADVITRREGERGLVLLTPHFGSFFLGYAFLCRLGLRCNGMSSSVTNDPQVIPEVQRYYFRKYRALEPKMNGGRILDQENGLKPFYAMLQRGEVLLVLADLPASPTGAAMQVNFLGERRGLAGGALRMAQQTGSDIGAYVCRHVGKGRYRLEFGPVSSCHDGTALDSIYQFFSDKIMETPGCWWGADLLQLIPSVAAASERGAEEMGVAFSADRSIA